MPDHLKSTDIDPLRKQLEQRRAALVGDIRNTLEDSGEENANALVGELRDGGEQAAADLVIDMRLANVEREIQELEATRDALVRMDRDEYGVCVNCGRPIPLDRLRAAPTAARCIDCQQALEQETGVEAPRQI